MTTETSKADLCRNCQAPLTGRWCAACGQKRLEDQDRRFGHLVSQFAHEMLHVEGKLPRSLWTLLLRPGRLTRAWFDGQRARYISPVALFLIINLIYFLAPPMTDFSLTLEDQLHFQPYSALITPLVEQRLAHRGLDLETYANHYQTQLERVAKTLIILHLPLMALVLWLAHPRREIYYAEHFVAATHFFTVFLIMTLLLKVLQFSAWHTGLMIFDAEWRTLSRQIWQSGPLIALTWWLIAMTRVYATRWYRSLLTLLIWSIGLVLAHVFVFRPAQFLLVFGLS
jgi:hypothetical protein